MFSNTAMTVEKLAKVMNRKNSVPHRRPPAMFVKTLGKRDKNQARACIGRDAEGEAGREDDKPAQTATKVSSTQMRAASPAG